MYSQRVREAFKGVPIVIGGIEASLRRIAHFDYWSDQVRRSLLVDAKADMLVYGNAERQVVAIAQRLDAGEPLGDITDLRGTAYLRRAVPRAGSRSIRASSTRPGRSHRPSILMPGRRSARLPAQPAGRRCAAAPAGERVHRVVKFFRKVPNAAARAQRHPPAVLRAR